MTDKDKTKIYAGLPRCIHGQALCDWSGEILQPPCGCTIDNANQRWKAMIILGFVDYKLAEVKP